jgi:thiol-disulfide isomerase/thioredoxin
MKPMFLLAFICCLFSCNLKWGKTNTAGISTLPSFDMLLMDRSTIVHSKEIPSGKPIIVIYFRPDCPHCNEETKLFINNIQSFKDVRFYYLTSASFEDIKGFYEHYNLNQYQNITIGKDYEHSFFEAFNPHSVPYMAINDGKKNLVKVYHGEVGINSLIAAVRS